LWGKVGAIAEVALRGSEARAVISLKFDGKAQEGMLGEAWSQTELVFRGSGWAKLL
jgi:hypothetical protein